ncbi:MAG: adenylate/guanylate cyclase domain-containing protein, partial [Candidatus Binatia bacterium]
STPSFEAFRAKAIQLEIAEWNERRGAAPIRVRIGLTAGEPVTEHEELFGAAVHQATRICEVCDPGNILASRVVRDLSIGKGFVWRDLGEVSLRGFDDSVQLYELRWAPEVDEQSGAEETRLERSHTDGGIGRPSARANAFLREGEYWTIVYEGKAFRLKDTKGLRYLSELLHNPGCDFHVTRWTWSALPRRGISARLLSGREVSATRGPTDSSGTRARSSTRRPRRNTAVG